MPPDLLTAPHLETELAALNAGLTVPWQVRRAALVKPFVFADFQQAIGFVIQAALVAEKMNHHPHWSNTYNQVAIELTTHSRGGITALDFRFAAQLEAIAGRTTR